MANLILGWCHHCRLGSEKIHDPTCPSRENYPTDLSAWDLGWDDARSGRVEWCPEGKLKAYQAGFRLGVHAREEADNVSYQDYYGFESN